MSLKANDLHFLVLPNPFSNTLSQASPRKLKRSRSPEEVIASAGEAGDDGMLINDPACVIGIMHFLCFCVSKDFLA